MRRERQRSHQVDQTPRVDLRSTNYMGMDGRMRRPRSVAAEKERIAISLVSRSSTSANCRDARDHAMEQLIVVFHVERHIHPRVLALLVYRNRRNRKGR